MDNDFLSRLKERGVKLPQQQLARLRDLYKLAAAYPAEKLREDFSGQLAQFQAAGFDGTKADAMLRYQFAHLLTQAWVDDWQQNYVNRMMGRILKVFTGAVMGLILLSQRQDMRLDRLEQWRAWVLVQMGQVSSLASRLSVLESRPQPTTQPLTGPVFEGTTTDNSIREMLRFRVSPTEIAGPRKRLFIFQGRSADGTANFYGEATVLWHGIGGGPVYDIMVVANATSTGAVIAATTVDFGTPNPYISLRVTGQAGAGVMTFTAYEVGTLQRPDPRVDPAYAGS